MFCTAMNTSDFYEIEECKWQNLQLEVSANNDLSLFFNSPCREG